MEQVVILHKYCAHGLGRKDKVRHIQSDTFIYTATHIYTEYTERKRGKEEQKHYRYFRKTCAIDIYS